MSTKSRPNDRTARQTDTPTPTSHAQRRYRQRINPREPEPAGRLRELFALAELEGDHPVEAFHPIALSEPVEVETPVETFTGTVEMVALEHGHLSIRVDRRDCVGEGGE
jgi:hypothetical protein